MLSDADLPANLIALPNGWRYQPLNLLVDTDRGISYGIVQPGSSDSLGVPIVRVNNLKQGRIITNDVLRVSAEVECKYQRTRLQGGEVLLTLVGTLGECALVPESLAGWNVARAIGVIPVMPEVNAKWICFCLRSQPIQHYIHIWATTTVQATLNLRDVAKLPIPVPPKWECEAITHILGTLDEKIELNRQMNETLEAIAQTLFKSWFVDFDPVRAKIEGRQPYGMDAETAALFPDEFEDSQLGMIPKGWEVRKLGEVATVNGQSITKDYPYQSIEYIDISSVTEGRLEGTTKCTLLDAPSRAKRLVNHGDTIWSTVRPNRKSYLFIHNPQDNLVVSTGFAVLTPCSIPPSYLYEWVTTEQFVDYLAYNADGSAYPAVLPKRFEDAVILLPFTGILQRFESQIKPIRDLIAQNESMSSILVVIRDMLLPKLLSGDIRVKDTEKYVEVAI